MHALEPFVRLVHRRRPGWPPRMRRERSTFTAYVVEIVDGRLESDRSPRRRPMRSRTSWIVGVLASRVSSPARYCCKDWPAASARR